MLRDPDCPRGLELGYQDIRSARTALRRWILLLRRLVYHLGAETEATHLLQKIADTLGLCIGGIGLEDEPCITELKEQKPMKEVVRVEWEAVKGRARTASGDADTRVVIEESLLPPGQAPQQLQVPLREVTSPPIQAMGPPSSSLRSQEAPRDPPLLKEPWEPASPGSGAATLLAQGPATPPGEPHPTPMAPGAGASPSKGALPRQAEQQSASESRGSPCRTPCLLDSAGVGRGRRIRELQKLTPGSPGINLHMDPAEEEEFLQSHRV